MSFETNHTPEMISQPPAGPPKLELVPPIPEPVEIPENIQAAIEQKRADEQDMREARATESAATAQRIIDTMPAFESAPVVAPAPVEMVSEPPASFFEARAEKEAAEAVAKQRRQEEASRIAQGIADSYPGPVQKTPLDPTTIEAAQRLNQ